jgi:hypothetical protein
MSGSGHQGVGKGGEAGGCDCDGIEGRRCGEEGAPRVGKGRGTGRRGWGWVGGG